MAGNVIEFVYRVEDDASKALGKIESSAKSAAKAAEQASDSADHMRKRTKALGDAAGDTDSILQAFAGALQGVSPAAAEAVRSLGDVSAVTEGVTKGFTLLNPVMGAIVISIGAAAGAWALFAKQLNDANEKVKEANRLAREAADANFEIKRAQLAVAVALGEATQAELDLLDARRESNNLFAESIERTRESIKTLEERRRSLENEKISENAVENAYRRSTGTLRDNSQAINVLNTQIEAKKKILDQLKTSQDDFNERLAQTKTKATEAAKAVKELKEETEDYAAINEALDEAAFEEEKKNAKEYAEYLAEIDERLKSIVGPDQGPQLPASQRGRNGRRLGILGEQVRIGARAGRAAVGQFAGNALSSVGLGGVPGAVGTAFGAIGPGIQSGLMGARTFFGTGAVGAIGRGLGAAGRGAAAGLGAIASPASAGGPIVSGLAAIGGLGRGADGKVTKSGVSDAIRDNLTGLKDTLIAALNALPEIIGSVIPHFIEQVVNQVIPALIDNLDEIIVNLVTVLVPALIKAIPALVKALAIDLPVALAKALGKVIASIFGIDAEKRAARQEIVAERKAGRSGLVNTLSDVGNALTLGIARRASTNKELKAQGFAKGVTNVDFTGPAVLHRGETVIPATGAGNQRQVAQLKAVAMGGGGGGVTIINNGMMGAGVADEIARMVDNRFSGFGGGKSVKFGGTT